MSWKLQSVPAPIPDGVQTIVDTLDSVATPLIAALDVLSTALNAAKIFFTSTSDPFSALVGSLLTEVQDLINDLFGTGVFVLFVDATKIEGRVAVDTFGIPTLKPDLALSTAVASFDDTGDTDRPQFSDSAQVAALGLLLTAPDVNEFIALFTRLEAVFDLEPFKRLLTLLNRKTNVVPPDPPVPSILPDWDSLKLNNIKAMSDIQVQLNNVLGLVQGYVTTPDDIINDLITILDRKVTDLQRIASDFQTLLETLANATAASGIHVLNVATNTGGNTYLKSQILELDTTAIRDNEYTAFVLFVGGGASLTTVETIRDLIVA